MTPTRPETSLVRNPFVSPEIMPVRCYCVLTLDLCNNAQQRRFKASSGSDCYAPCVSVI
ncbi:MAG: hypothetical protein VB140_10175 [Burkholderia sp.]